MEIKINFDDSLIPIYIDILLRRYGHERIKGVSDYETFKDLCHEAVHYEIMKQMAKERPGKIERIKPEVQKIIKGCIDNLQKAFNNIDDVLQEKFTDEE